MGSWKTLLRRNFEVAYEWDGVQQKRQRDGIHPRSALGFHVEHTPR